jgi:hypothetical protein
VLCWSAVLLQAQQTQKPPLHARHRMAITGVPLGATAGAPILARGDNAVDAASLNLDELDEKLGPKIPLAKENLPNLEHLDQFTFSSRKVVL